MAMESLSIMDEPDSEPTLEDIYQALDQLSSGKSPGNDSIPVEFIKCEEKEHTSRNYMRYFANAGEKVRFRRT